MDYTVKDRQMTCASAEAEKCTYVMQVGKSGRRWLYPDCGSNSASHIYVEGEKNSQGFGGRTLTFKLTPDQLVENGEIKLKGPWHSNSEALFEDTGVDLRDTHVTFVVVSKGREHLDMGECGWYKTVMTDVLYIDDEPTSGSFRRGDEIAKKYANDLGEPVFLHSQSNGGSSTGQVKPDEEV